MAAICAFLPLLLDIAEGPESAQLGRAQRSLKSPLHVDSRRRSNVSNAQLPAVRRRRVERSNRLEADDRHGAEIKQTVRKLDVPLYGGAEKPIFATFSALLAHRPRNSGSASRAAEFSHGLQDI